MIRPSSVQLTSQNAHYLNTIHSLCTSTMLTVLLLQGLYQCVATNNVGSVMKNSHVVVIKRTKVSALIRIRVVSKDYKFLTWSNVAYTSEYGQVSIVSEEGPQEISIHAGQQAKLPCQVDNDERNRITNIEWTKDGDSIQVGVEDRIDFGYDGSLIIFNVQKRHEGQCNQIIIDI